MRTGTVMFVTGCGNCCHTETTFNRSPFKNTYRIPVACPIFVTLRMHRFPAYLILLCILLRSAEMQAHAVHVQDVVLPPQGDKGFNDPKPQGEFDVLAIPLKRVQNLYMVEARVDSLVGYFILDTGAPHLVLNRTYFNKGRTAPGATQYGINGGANTVLNTVVDTLSVGELFYTLVDADIVNLGHLENARGVRILGLLGASLFSSMEMELDLLHDIMYLYRLDDQGNRLAPADSTLPDLEIPLEVDNNILFLYGRIAGKKMRFCLDTGAERNVLSNTVSNKVLSHFSLTTRGQLAGSGNSATPVLNGIIDSVSIGSSTFGNMPFLLTNLSYLELVYNTTLSGIMGYDLLIQGRTVINMRKKKLTMYFYRPEADVE